MTNKTPSGSKPSPLDVAHLLAARAQREGVPMSELRHHAVPADGHTSGHGAASRTLADLHESGASS